jgi:hypothetical protein
MRARSPHSNATPDPRRQAIGRYGAAVSWARTPDRTARTRNARRASPADVDWHLARLDPERFAGASDAQKLAAAEAARTAYFLKLSEKAAEGRRRAAANRTPRPLKHIPADRIVAALAAIDAEEVARDANAA